MLPLRFTFNSESVKSSKAASDEDNSPKIALDKDNSPKIALPRESWSQRYSTPICLMLTAFAGFVSGYNLGRYRSKFS